MEVHHHPDLYHKKKKWKEYFLEFLMIFLAVSMGFIAENIREHFADREKEKQCIETIISGIASDTVQLKNVLASNTFSLSYLHKFIKLKNSDFSLNDNRRKFYDDVANGAYNDVYFTTNGAAFQQLQASGTMRLINKKGILESLFKYQYNNSLILRIEPDHYLFSKYVWEGMSKLMDVTYTLNSFDSVSFNYNGGIYKVPEGADLVFNYDKQTVDKIFNDACGLALNAEIYINLLNQQLMYGSKLTGLLKKEYTIE